MRIDFKNIKDINTTTMSRRKLNNKAAFEELVKCDSKLISKIKKCMDNGGFVYYFEYKKIIKSIYLFDIKDGVAKCSYELISQDIDYDDLDYLNTALIDDLNYLITSKKVNEVIWNNKTITPMTVQFEKYCIPLFIFSVLFGGLLGYLINSFLLGLLFGFITGLIAFYSMRK